MIRNFDADNFVNRLKNNCRLIEIKEFHADKDDNSTTEKPDNNETDNEAQKPDTDKDGNKKILYYYTKNDVFGEPIFKLYMNREVFVLAKEKCKVLFYPYDLAENCTEDCLYHIEILKNLPDLVFTSIANQNFRMLLLTSKGVRDKLLTYFQILSNESHSKSFELPMSLTDLSDYLMIERTAMMREIKRMKEEKIIKKNKNKITLN